MQRVWGEETRGYTGFWWGNLRERDHLGDTGIDGRKYYDGSSGSQMWVRALANAVMNLRGIS